MAGSVGQEESWQVRKKFSLNQETNQNREAHFSRWGKKCGENNREAFWVPRILLPFLV